MKINRLFVSLTLHSLLLLFLSACERQEIQDELENITSEIQSLSICEIMTDQVSQQWYFYPDPESRPGHLVTNIIDSLRNIPQGMTSYLNAKRTIDYDVRTGKISKVHSRNYRTGSINYHSGYIIPSFYNFTSVENYSTWVATTPSSPGFPWAHDSVYFQIYNDTLQQHEVQTVIYSISEIIGSQLGSWSYFEDLDNIAHKRGNQDSMLYEDNSIFMQRFFDFYRSLPFYYNPKEIDLFRYHGNSFYSCDSFVLRNGEYEIVYTSPTYYNKVFHPSLERKITYLYTADTVQIKQFVSLYNMNTLDDHWYLLSKRKAVTQFDEDEGHYNSLYWLANKSTDSVFTYTTTGVRTLRTVITTTNEVSRDSKGRIVKIIKRRSDSPYHRIMEIVYK
ncbi:MAG: hypothetical protein JNN29_14520 [Chitinophagaceae bacterium]|nr:hypothetical protein [Chitinophagaceae bacterium]